jgi:hypothetical protein
MSIESERGIKQEKRRTMCFITSKSFFFLLALPYLLMSQRA